MRGFFNVLQLLGECTGSEYSSCYADVKTELYKLFNKYENKFGAARSQRVAQPSIHTGKKTQTWGRIFGGHGGSDQVLLVLALSLPPHLHLPLLFVSSQLT
jgi:hypothetical protein